MVVVYVVGGLVLLAVIWAVVKASSGRTDTIQHAYDPPIQPTYEPPQREWKETYDWKEGSRASVSNRFGHGGAPSGTSFDSGTAVKGKYDEDLEMLKHAKPFEPRALPKTND